MFANGDAKKDKENVHHRIEELCQKIEEKEESVRKKREELHKYVERMVAIVAVHKLHH